MKEKIQSFLFSRKVLGAATFIMCIAMLVNVNAKFMIGLYQHAIVDFIFTICTAALYFAFIKHNKNVQKGLLGAVLAWYLVDEVSYVFGDILLNPALAPQYQNSMGTVFIILTTTGMIAYCVVFINNFIMTGDHKARPYNLGIAFWASFITSILSLVTMILQAILEPTGIALTENISWHIMLIAFMVMIGSYENHFEVWKENRETY